jgi:hypothetical protein
MVEFTLNSAISSSSGFAPFELNYGHMPHINPGFVPTPSEVPGVKHFVTHTLQNLADAHDALIESHIQQTHYANCQCCKDDSFMAGNLIYVSTADLSLPKGQATKLLPKYIGPFKILKAHSDKSTYKVELPALLHARNLHNQLHRSKLRPYYANDDALFPHCEAHAFYDFSTPNDREQLVDEIIAHKWDDNNLMFQLCWNDGDTTWESHETCKDLQVLDEYLDLISIKKPYDLPHHGILH